MLQQLDVTEEHQISHVQHYELVQAGEVVVVVGGKVEQVMLVLGVSCSYIVDYWRQKPLSTLFCAEELQVFDELFDSCCQNFHINITDQQKELFFKPLTEFFTLTNLPYMQYWKTSSPKPSLQ